jgi:hypothetical protein
MVKRRHAVIGAVALALGWGAMELRHTLHDRADEPGARRTGTAFRALERCLVGDSALTDEALVQHVDGLLLTVPDAERWPSRCAEHVASLELAAADDFLEARVTLPLLAEAIEKRDAHAIVQWLAHLRRHLAKLPHDDVSQILGPVPRLPQVRLVDASFVPLPLSGFQTTAWASGPVRLRLGSAACAVDPSDEAAALRCAHPPDTAPESARFERIVAGAEDDAPTTAIDLRATFDGITAYEVESGRILASLERRIVRGAFRDPHRLRLLSASDERFFLSDVFVDTLREIEIDNLDRPFLLGKELLAVHDRGGVSHLVAVPIDEGPALASGVDLGPLSGKPDLAASRICATPTTRFIAVPLPEAQIVVLAAVTREGYRRMVDVHGQRATISCYDQTLRVVVHDDGAVEQRCSVDGCKAFSIVLPDAKIWAVAPQGRDAIVALSGAPHTAVRLGPPDALRDAPVLGYLEGSPSLRIDRVHLYPREGATLALIEGGGGLIPIRIAKSLAPIPIRWIELPQ